MDSASGGVIGTIDAALGIISRESRTALQRKDALARAHEHMSVSRDILSGLGIDSIDGSRAPAAPAAPSMPASPAAAEPPTGAPADPPKPRRRRSANRIQIEVKRAARRKSKRGRRGKRTGAPKAKAAKVSDKAAASAARRIARRTLAAPASTALQTIPTAPTEPSVSAFISTAKPMPVIIKPPAPPTIKPPSKAIPISETALSMARKHAGQPIDVIVRMVCAERKTDGSSAERRVKATIEELIETGKIHKAPDGSLSTTGD